MDRDRELRGLDRVDRDDTVTLESGVFLNRIHHLQEPQLVREG
jgi:hypothetical protein